MLDFLSTCLTAAADYFRTESAAADFGTADGARDWTNAFGTWNAFQVPASSCDAYQPDWSSTESYNRD